VGPGPAWYAHCNLSARRGVDIGDDRPGSLEQTVFSCDYNGWADVPEEEREAIDAFETFQASLWVQRPILPPVLLPSMPALPAARRRAA
jgi:hypothetical protein